MRDVQGFESWAKAVLKRAREEQVSRTVDPHWWRHAAIKLAEKGLADLKTDSAQREDR